MSTITRVDAPPALTREVRSEGLLEVVDIMMLAP